MTWLEESLQWLAATGGIPLQVTLCYMIALYLLIMLVVKPENTQQKTYYRVFRT